MRFTTQEYAEMVICYGMARENSREAVRIYTKRFLGQDHYPTKNTIASRVRRVRETRSVLPWTHHNCDAPPRLRVDDEERILCKDLKKIQDVVCTVQLVHSGTRDTRCIAHYGEMHYARIITNGFSSFLQEIKSNVFIFVKVI